MKKVLVLILALGMVLSFVACAQPGVSTESPIVSDAVEPSDAAEPSDAVEPSDAAEPSSDEVSDDLPLAGKVIGNTIVYKGDVWCSILAQEFEQQAAALGAEITVEDGDINAETQNKQIENMIARNVDVIFADPATLDGCTPAFEKAHEAGIPILTYDSEPSYENIIAHTGWDNYETGRMVGEYVIDYVNENLNGEAKIVLLGNYASEHCVHREQEFEKVIEATDSKITIISKQDCEGNREKAANAIANIVEPFNIVVSVVDNGAWGAVSALEARGATDVKVFCMGAYGDEPFQALRDGHPIYEACLIVDPAEIARLTLDNYVKYVEGKTDEIEKITNIPLYICNTENIADFYSFPNG